jgi:molybdate transport system ATP-binding protein
MSVTLAIEVGRDGFTLAANWSVNARTIGLFGPSGAGKTSLLHAMAGLLPLPAARWSIDGIAIDAQRPRGRGLGLLFQEASLLPHRSVAQNFAHAARRTERDPEPSARALDLLPLSDRRPAQLSGGERRRAAVVAALLSARVALLLDEPFAGLDDAMVDRVIDLVAATVRAEHLVLFVASHRAVPLLRLCETVSTLDAGSASTPSSVAELAAMDLATAPPYMLALIRAGKGAQR